MIELEETSEEGVGINLNQVMIGLILLACCLNENLGVDYCCVVVKTTAV
jgi:hypothetical protein